MVTASLEDVVDEREPRFVLHGVPWSTYVVVAEVWEWRPTSLVVHRLVGDHYVRQDRSLVLPDLDLAHLATFVIPGENQTQLAKAYQASLR